MIIGDRKIIVRVTEQELACIQESADLNNSGVAEWCKRMIINATITNDEKRLKIRGEFRK